MTATDLRNVAGCEQRLAEQPGTDMTEVTKYTQDGVRYICVGDGTTAAGAAWRIANAALAAGERLVGDMDRVDGCCTWTVINDGES
jgi:hypothetical protein